MTNLTAWLIAGSVTGWLASVLLGTKAQSLVVLNVLAGAAGAILGGWALSPLVGSGSGNQPEFSVSALLMSFVGAAVFLGAVHYFRRGVVR
jgi:uncharacterized membrane protein YeaQ/YmgE (transglycosylase-associated protein family)